ncbi:MAG: serine hydrolase [Bacteroidetes bacterium]|nr:serine hydrolase [Bacteroidota bacterium]
MKKLIRTALIGLLVICGAVSVSAQDKAKVVDSILRTYNKLGKFNGTALVAQYGRVIYDKGYGYKDAATKQKNDSNTIYQIGSITKTFTSTLILMLQEQGKLNITDKLSKYFPDYPDGDRITIANLLTHTSGIYNYTEDTSFMSKQMLSHKTQDDMIKLFKDKPLAFRPGAKFSYSNSNYMLLGYIIEKVTGKTYYAVLREMIFVPLGMNNSGADFVGLKNKNKATGYLGIDGDNGVKAPFVDSSVSYSAGCIYTTAPDMYKWANAVLHHELLSAAIWDSATTNRMDNYGYGWMVGELYGGKSIGHNGGVHGFVSNLYMTPNDASVVILLSNSMDADLAEIRRQITAAINNKPFELPEIRREIKLDPKTLAEYVGVYDYNPSFSIRVYIENGKLMGQATNQNPFQLYAARKDFFFLKVVDAQTTFVRDSGKVTKMMLRQAGVPILTLVKK